MVSHLNLEGIFGFLEMSLAVTDDLVLVLVLFVDPQ